MDSAKRNSRRRRLYWIAAVRSVLCVFAAGIAWLNLKPSASPAHVLPFAVAGAAFASNIMWVALAWTRLPERLLAAAQLVADVGFVTALVYATGGVSSDFLLLYFGPVLAAAVCSGRAATVFAASLSTMGLFSCAALYGIQNGHPVLVASVWLGRQATSAASLAGVLALQATAFHVVALLASTLIFRLRSANIQTGQILENMSDGVITVGKNGHIVYANSRARRMLGAAKDEPLLGRRLDEIVPSAICEAFRRMVETSEERTLETDLGPVGLPALIVVSPVSDHAGAVRGANVILHDITERRKLTEALRRADRLEAAATTVASIAHEIRNPLAAIRGSAQELRASLAVSGQDKRLMDLVVSESDRLNRILSEFLSFSRMSKPQMAPFDIRALLDEVAAEIKATYRGAAPAVTVRGASGVTLTGDSEQLRQVFVNLGLNAVEASGGAGTLVFELDPRGASAVVRALDHGPAFDEALKERFFEPFFTTKTAGTGLGLSIAKRIVEDHRGTIGISRTPDGWTSVEVELPLAAGKPVLPVATPPVRMKVA